MSTKYQEWTNKVLSTTEYHGMEKYDYRALCFAEEYGIIEYKVSKNEMIFYSSYPLEHMTYKAIVNLDTMKETRTAMKRYYKAYHGKIGGVQINYCA